MATSERPAPAHVVTVHGFRPPHPLWLPIALSVLLACPLAADVLILQNGQKVEGEIQDKGDAYDVKTKFGSLTVAKTDVKRRIKDPAATAKEIEVLGKSAREMADEGLKIDGDAAVRNQKLEAAATLYEQAIAICADARRVYTGGEFDNLDKMSAALGEELGKLRAKMTPDVLAPPKSPAAAPAGAKPDPAKPEGPAPGKVEGAGAAKPADPAVLAAAPAPGRHAVPPADRVRAAEAQIRNLFKADYAVSAPEDRKALAQKLLKTAQETKDDDESVYALLGEARAAAAQAGDAETAVQAIEETARLFAVDADKMADTTLGKLEAAVRTPEAARDVAEVYLRANLEAVAADQYDIAQAVVGRADRLARAAQDPALLLRAQEQIKDTQEIIKEAGAIKSSLKTLKENPDDPAANAAVGSFLCFVKADWEKGIPLLAKGSDADLKALAEAEFVKPALPSDQAALGDRWASWGEKQPGSKLKGRGRDRALVWYEAALPGLTGPAKAKVDKKIRAYVETLAAQLGGLVVPGNVALATNGTTAAGTPSAPLLIDGVTTGYTGSTGFASLSWPGEWVITFPKVYVLREIRLLLWDGDTDRYYHYIVETSADGKAYTPLVDRSKGKWRSWQTLDFLPRRVKTIRIKGLFNSANSGFYIVECEAYCLPPAQAMKPKAASEPTETPPRPAAPARPGARGE